jgi:phage-related protein
MMVVHVLHILQKRSTRDIATPRRELELVRARLRQAEAIDAERRRQGW